MPFANGALANGVFQSVTGDVQAAEGAGTPEGVSTAQRFRAGASIATGAGSRAVLKFDDGHTLVLYENTEVRVAEYRFDRDRPQQDAMRLQLLKGALRSVTGLMGQRSRERVTLSMPQATVGLEGTDFMAMLAGSAYVSVLHGAVALGNAAGSVKFASPSLGAVADAARPAAPVAASELPPEVSAAFASLRGVAVGPGIEPGSGGPSAGVFGASPGKRVAATAAALALAVAAIASAASTETFTASHH